MAEIIYQTVNFHFMVGFNFEPGSTTDIRFQAVSVLDSAIDTDTVNEGGENRFEHVVPVRRKYGPLVLKRGLIKPEHSGLTRWLKTAFDDETVTPIPTVNIHLLNEKQKTLMHWTVSNVWPRSWRLGELNAEQGAVLIETLELNYNTLLFDNPLSDAN